MMATLGYLLTRAACKFPDKEALVCEGKRITYRQFNERADKLACALISLGIRKGMRIALLLEESIEYVECLFGISRAGAISVPVNNRFKLKEIQYVISINLRCSY